MTTEDVARRVRAWLVDVSVEANPVRHPAPCGTRIDAPCGNTDLSPLKPAERLRTGTVACHRCGLSFRPGEPAVCGRRPK